MLHPQHVRLSMKKSAPSKALGLEDLERLLLRLGVVSSTPAFAWCSWSAFTKFLWRAPAPAWFWPSNRGTPAPFPAFPRYFGSSSSRPAIASLPGLNFGNPDPAPNTNPSTTAETPLTSTKVSAILEEIKNADDSNAVVARYFGQIPAEAFGALIREKDTLVNANEDLKDEIGALKEDLAQNKAELETPRSTIEGPSESEPNDVVSKPRCFPS